MLKKFVRIFGGDPNKREIEKYSDLVDEINNLEPDFEKLSIEELKGKTAEFRARLDEGETLDDILPEAFAAVREASKRTIGLRHYDVQLIGGAAMHQGIIAEMRTGEGKTLVATLPIYLNALTGRGVHLITVNDYLARRDARWMAPIYDLLGLSIGVLQMASRTENGKKAFMVDLERESPHEDQHQLRMVPRIEAYAADITYGTNSEFGFDYLRDNMAMSMEDRVQRGHYYAIVDEVDNVLIDEARTPLIISGPAQDEAEWYIRMAQVVKQLRPEDYEISEKDRTVTLTEIGEVHVEEILGMALRDPDRPEDVTHEQARLLGYLEQAMRAQYLFRRNKDYLVQAGKVVIIDEFTGRLMPGRRWSDGLHQAVEAKEGVRVQSESVTYATITIQNYFRMYEKLSGMTGTAVTEAEEFDEIYKLEVLAIPTNLEYQASRSDSGLNELEARDEQGYKYKYYAQEDDPDREAVFWKRKDYPDVVYRTEEAKLRAIAKEILHYHVLGRPMLVGTTSVELSDRVSSRLRAEPLRRLALVLLLRDAWMEANNREEDGRQIPELQFFNAPLENLNISEMRKFSRDLGISFNPEDESNIEHLLAILNLSPSDGERLVSDLQAGIPHEVLNARKHTEESQIIAGAGAYGAVTIATNMAGRGVDIKLGGELAEEIMAAVSRVLRRNGYDEPYDMTMEQRREALLSMDPADYGIYDSEIKYFLQYIEDMERVRKLGGLHVIGSERHEARRIDNQLRGRSARQGDPGSSRFYLSMEDELMRLFGGQQADNLMQRLKIDDALPLEVGLVSRIVEQSQTRVEGANFDVRKHLLEYDDVLNTQREKIYSQRDLVFEKDDLSEDVTDMLRTEVLRRVPEALEDEEGPWKLLAWLDQIQPPFTVNGTVFPSYTLRLIVDDIFEDVDEEEEILSRQEALEALLEIARQSLDAEKQRLLITVNMLLDQTQDRLDEQLDERMELIDTFFEGLSLSDETDTRRPADLVNELSSVLHLPLRLSSDQQKALRENPDEVIDDTRSQVESIMISQAITRLIGSIERRLEDTLEIDTNELESLDWNALAEKILKAIENVFSRREERYLGEQGQITKDMENSLDRIDGPVTRMHLYQLLLILPQGARATFDRKTHRRVWQRTLRLTYVYYAASFLDNLESEVIADEVLDHLEEAQETMRQAWGKAELERLSIASIADLDDTAQRGLQEALGEEGFAQIASQSLNSLSQDERELVIDELGRQALTMIYRQLILSVVTELWVDYLTQMEALRISIGLEAYAQRDPLVQYKSRAFELFQNLLSDMRMGVVTRMFTYQPRDFSSVQTGVARSEAAQPEAVAAVAAESAEAMPEGAATQPIQEQKPDGRKPAPKRTGKKEKMSVSKKRRRSRR
jgi:preprotein translocase subunit SecA